MTEPQSHYPSVKIPCAKTLILTQKKKKLAKKPTTSLEELVGLPGGEHYDYSLIWWASSCVSVPHFFSYSVSSFILKSKKMDYYKYKQYTEWLLNT